jgi:hypothetical protein
VQRHQRGFREAQQEEHVDDDEQRAAGTVVEDPAADEVEGAGLDVGHGDRG